MKNLFLLSVSIFLLLLLMGKTKAQVIIAKPPVTCTTYCTDGIAGQICTVRCE